jgi:voltage-gated potassium channel
MRWPFLDAFYQIVITVASVGFMEVHPLSSAGRVFTIFVIFIGMGTVVYVLGTVTAFVVEGELTNILRRRRMDRKIRDLQDHYIVCGVSRAGRHVVRELEKNRRPLVVVEKDPERLKLLAGGGDLLSVTGDATSEEVLLEAGLARASGLVTTLPQDQDNLFVVLTARRLNPRLRIVSLAVEESSEGKLRDVGADGVVSSFRIGGMRLASELIRPAVVSFLDLMLRREDATIRVEEATIGEGSAWVGRALGDVNVPAHADVVVVGMKKASSGDLVFNPRPGTVLAAGDTIVMIAEVGEVEKVRRLAQSPAG